MRFGPMLRTVDIVLLIALFGVVSWTFKVKHESQEALERVSELEKQIAAERIEIDLLKSDWSLLTNPARLQKLVERYKEQLGLDAVTAVQMAEEEEFENIPPASLSPANNTGEGHAEIDSQTKTGSVGGDQ